MMLQSSTIRQRKAPPPGIYDPAGNILSKTVAGRTTTYTYDKANQLVSSKNADGKVTRYEYDAAGRMVKEGEKTFAYGWLDKVMQVAENGKTTQSYSYDISGQLATADYGDSRETFLWDGLALLSRNNLKYVNEPAVTGGNPILAGDKMLFDDMLGNTLGVKDGEKFSAIDRDAFGELKPGEKPNLAVNFFTGKPEIDGLGYSFLLRNYRADLGKWQTTDPLGYPDGWNNLAYVNNGVTMAIDWMGAAKKRVQHNIKNPALVYANFLSSKILGYTFTVNETCGAIDCSVQFDCGIDSVSNSGWEDGSSPNATFKLTKTDDSVSGGSTIITCTATSTIGYAKSGDKFKVKIDGKDYYQQNYKVWITTTFKGGPNEYISKTERTAYGLQEIKE